jgi:hypothetical protein
MEGASLYPYDSKRNGAMIDVIEKRNSPATTVSTLTSDSPGSVGSAAGSGGSGNKQQQRQHDFSSTRSVGTTRSTTSAKSNVHGNLMRTQISRNPMDYYAIEQMLGEGSMVRHPVAFGGPPQQRRPFFFFWISVLSHPPSLSVALSPPFSNRDRFPK